MIFVWVGGDKSSLHLFIYYLGLYFSVHYFFTRQTSMKQMKEKKSSSSYSIFDMVGCVLSSDLIEYVYVVGNAGIAGTLFDAASSTYNWKRFILIFYLLFFFFNFRNEPSNMNIRICIMWTWACVLENATVLFSRSWSKVEDYFIERYVHL